MTIKKALVATMGAAAVFGAGLVFSTTSANADTKVTVKTGDTVWELAQKYDSTVNAIEKANDLTGDMIAVGQKLVIPNADQAKKLAKATVSSDKAYTNAKAGNGKATPTSTSGLSASDAAAKAWIAFHESSDSYTAQNGKYIGKYQLDASYLNGDYSPANQERVANEYVADRYGSWTNAQAFWQSHGWY